MRRIGQVRGSRSTGQVERLLLVGLGLLVVLIMQTPLFGGLRSPAGSAGGRSASLATPVGTPLPTSVPLEATAPASAADEGSPAAEPSRAPLVDPPSYQVQAGGSGANLRGAPSTTAPVLEQVHDGAIVTNLDQQETVGGQLWRRVADGTTEGWMAADLLVPAQ
ncbi:MAG TPA: SH3 domain-containing protein [Chloroflexota bacterium]|nr:SH3 domain-containing protein [Chloroflexota bacterium]